MLPVGETRCGRFYMHPGFIALMLAKITGLRLESCEVSNTKASGMVLKPSEACMRDF
jgi:hypothetical protein